MINSDAGIPSEHGNYSRHSRKKRFFNNTGRSYRWAGGEAPRSTTSQGHENYSCPHDVFSRLATTSQQCHNFWIPSEKSTFFVMQTTPIARPFRWLVHRSHILRVLFSLVMLLDYTYNIHLSVSIHSPPFEAVWFMQAPSSCWQGQRKEPIIRKFR